jgi:glycosyltransferase involved in cell wall biosynthesis
MRIVISNSARRWGGGEAMAAALALGLHARGHHVAVFCRADSALQERLEPTVACEPILGGFDLHPVTLARCARALRRHRPDVVVVNTSKDPRWTGVAAWMLGIPVVFRQEIDEAFRDRRYYRFLYGRIPSAYVVNSAASRRSMVESVNWIDPDRVSVIPNGVEIDRFAYAAPASLDLPAGAVAVGYVGRFSEEKGVADLIDAWPRIAERAPDAWLLLSGHGPLEEELRARAALLPRVRWIGFRPDLPAVMQALDVLAIPSRSEGFGLVAAEAMAARLPVVSTRAGGLPEVVVDGETGVLVPPRDPVAFADAVLRVLGDPALRAHLAASGGPDRARAKFSMERMIGAHEVLFGRLAAERAA